MVAVALKFSSYLENILKKSVFRPCIKPESIKPEFEGIEARHQHFQSSPGDSSVSWRFRTMCRAQPLVQKHFKALNSSLNGNDKKAHLHPETNKCISGIKVNCFGGKKRFFSLSVNPTHRMFHHFL